MTNSLQVSMLLHTLSVLEKRPDTLSFKIRRSQGEKHLSLFKLLISYLTRAKKIIRPCCPLQKFQNSKGTQGAVRILDGWNDSSPTLRVRLMAGHRPPTTGERGFDIPYVTGMAERKKVTYGTFCCTV